MGSPFFFASWSVFGIAKEAGARFSEEGEFHASQ